MNTLLLIDDHQIIRDGIRFYFEDDNEFEIKHEAENGLEALELLKEHQYDVVLTDINMPDMDGLEFLLALRKNQKTQRIGFIMVSGTFNQTVVDLGKRLGMNNFLKKPFTDDTLKQCVESVTGPL